MSHNVTNDNSSVTSSRAENIQTESKKRKKEKRPKRKDFFARFTRWRVLALGKYRKAQNIIGDVWQIALPLFLVIGLIVVITRFWIWATSWLG